MVRIHNKHVGLISIFFEGLLLAIVVEEDIYGGGATEMLGKRRKIEY